MGSPQDDDSLLGDTTCRIDKKIQNNLVKWGIQYSNPYFMRFFMSSDHKFFHRKKIMILAILCTMVLMILFGLLGIVGWIALLLLLLLQIFVMVKTPTNSSIHDLLADTVVVDYASQQIFETQEELIAFKEEQHRLEVEATKETTSVSNAE